MSDFVRAESLNFEIDDIRYVEADEDFSSGYSSYGSTIFAEIHLYINEKEITHENKLPADFDLVDTAKAQAEIIEALNENQEYTGKPFCCTCGDRGCAYIHWSVSIANNKIELVMEDLLEEEIGDHKYALPISVFKKALLELFDELLDFMRSENIEIFEWAEWKETPVAGRDNYATLEQLERYKQEIEDFGQR